MELDGTELHVLMMRNPYKDVLDNKPVHCVLLPGAITERKTYSGRWHQSFGSPREWNLHSNAETFAKS